MRALLKTQNIDAVFLFTIFTAMRCLHLTKIHIFTAYFFNKQVDSQWHVTCTYYVQNLTNKNERYFSEKIKERMMKKHEGVIDLYEVFVLPFAITIFGAVVYIYSMTLQAGTP